MRMVGWLLVALWLPVTQHCLVETITGLGYLSCCTHSDAIPHQDNDCDEDACAVVESGDYFVPDNSFCLVPALVLVADLCADKLFDLKDWTGVQRHLPGLAPDALGRSWQFLLRAAPSIRAPSLLA